MTLLKNNILPQIAFIIGMGRSGTTLLTNMLNCNPNVISTPENEFIIFMRKTFVGKNFGDEKVVKSFLDVFEYNYNNVLSIWTPDNDLKLDIARLENKTFANVCKLIYLNYPFADKAKVNIKCVVDKNPSYSLHLNVLNDLYVDAKYIVLVRDFRDNILSRKTKSETKKSIYKLAVSWNFYYERIFRDIKKFNLKHQIIRYEDLVTDPQGELKKICEFLEIPYDERMLNYQELSKKIKSHIKENASVEIFNKIDFMHSNLEKEVNLDRIKAYEKELTTYEINMLNCVCAEFGKRFHYINENNAFAGRMKFKWRIKVSIARTNLIFYHFLNKMYYNFPVALRIIFLKKRK